MFQRFITPRSLSIAGFFVFLLFFFSLATNSVGGFVDALADYQDQVQLLERIESRTKNKTLLAVVKPAPDDALILKSSATLAGAFMNQKMSQIVADGGARLISSSILPKGDHAAHIVRVQMVFEAYIDQLQAVLLSTETGMPYMMVDDFNIRPVDTTEKSLNPLLRVTLGVRAVWVPSL